MCGIAGIIPFKNTVNLTKINDMIEAIAHRGPDQKEKFKSKNSIFGFVRLKIIDLSNKSNQPFYSEDKKVKIIYNGEIYNFIELKNTYFKNIKFKSNGDGEVILHLYLKFGIGFVNKLSGMYSIAIIDERINTTYLVRDRFGIKPLYYYSDKEQIIFCSEIQGILKAINKKLEINKKEAFRYFKQGLVNSTKETWFKNIFQVRQSCYLEIKNNNNIVTKYNISEIQFNLNVGESLEQKREYILKYKADILVMGNDWEGKFDEFKDICEVIYFPRTENISTTKNNNKTTEIYFLILSLSCVVNHLQNRNTKDLVNKSVNNPLITDISHSFMWLIN